MKIFIDTIKRKIFFTKDGRKVTEIMTIPAGSTVRRCSKFKFIVTGKSPVLVNLKGSSPVAIPIDAESKIGRRYARA